MGTVRLFRRGDLGTHIKTVVGYSEPLPDDTFKDAGLKMNSKWLLHRDSLGYPPLELFSYISLPLAKGRLSSSVSHMLQFWPALLFYVHCKIYSLFLNPAL